MDHTNLITLKAACKVVGCKSRNTLEYHIRAGHVRFIWISDDLRLLYREDINKLAVKQVEPKEGELKCT